MQNFLKFRYFLLALFLISCGGNATKEGKQKATDTEASTAPQDDAVSDKIILFFGNSLTAGYGLDTEEAFPALVQDRLDSLGLQYTAINSGLSGETTSGGLNRLNWVLNQDIAVFVLELGANDGLRGLPLKETRSNLQAMIDLVRSKNADTRILLAGMQIPPNLGPDYTREFKTMYKDLAEKNDIELIPFLLEGVAGIPELNLEDGIHPTAEGQKIVMENVWEVLRNVLD